MYSEEKKSLLDNSLNNENHFYNERIYPSKNCSSEMPEFVYLEIPDWNDKDDQLDLPSLIQESVDSRNQLANRRSILFNETHENGKSLREEIDDYALKQVNKKYDFTKYPTIYAEDIADEAIDLFLEDDRFHRRLRDYQILRDKTFQSWWHTEVIYRIKTIAEKKRLQIKREYELSNGIITEKKTTKQANRQLNPLIKQLILSSINNSLINTRDLRFNNLPIKFLTFLTIECLAVILFLPKPPKDDKQENEIKIIFVSPQESTIIIFNDNYDNLKGYILVQKDQCSISTKILGFIDLQKSIPEIIPIDKYLERIYKLENLEVSGVGDTEKERYNDARQKKLIRDYKISACRETKLILLIIRKILSSSRLNKRQAYKCSLTRYIKALEDICCELPLNKNNS